jgi:xylulokinase
MAATALGRFASLEQAVGRYVRYTEEVRPVPAWAETYGRMQPIYDRLYEAAKPFYGDLDRLAEAASGAG